MNETHVVTAFLRHGPYVLLTRRSDTVGTDQGRWAGISGHAEGDPDSQVWVEIRAETGLDADPDAPDAGGVALVCAGDPFDVVDESAAGERHWVVHPYLFDVATRQVTPNEELAAVEWVPATAIRDRDTVPGLWDAYDRVRPTVDTIRTDRDHGAAYLSRRALDVLRDEAALAEDWPAITAVARDLLDARPDMAAVQNRVNRVLYEASVNGPRTPTSVHDTAIDVAEAAMAADDRAAQRATELVEGTAVATHSRSGTVLNALCEGAPSRVVISESRPGSEGVDVATSLADAGLAVTLTSDANLPNRGAEAGVVLVGADAVWPDGSVVNKVGTHALARTANAYDVPCYAVCAAAKVATEPTEPTESAEPDTLTTDAIAPSGLAIDNPLFDVTPADLLTGIVTESGIMDADDVENLADEHRRFAQWE